MWKKLFAGRRAASKDDPTPDGLAQAPAAPEIPAPWRHHGDVIWEQALAALVEPQGARVQVATRQVERAALAPLGLIPSVWA